MSCRFPPTIRGDHRDVAVEGVRVRAAHLVGGHLTRIA